MDKLDPVVIVSAARTPMGAFQGGLKDLTAPEIGAIALKAALARAGLDAVDEVLMGNVLPAGVGQNPARQAALGAGLGMETPSTTISKVCGSGMKALMLGHDTLLSGGATALAVGGMESMTNAPYLLPKARGGFRLGHGEVKDHMFLDGLEDAYSGRLMGTYAEDTAEHYQFSREDQDAFALRSLERAVKALEDGSFAEETVAINGAGKRQTVTLDHDEQPGKADPAKIPKLKPAFRENGSVTAANSSSISDGAAALILMRASEAEKRGLTPLAIVAGHAGHAQEPAWFTTAPIGAIEKLLSKLDWEKNSVGLYEINEAFAVVAMAAVRDLGLSDDIVNIHGGACALGHPIGASGARIIVTLLHAMRAKGVRRGIASLCIGGGEATAVGLELLQ
ncbi:MULTISPECIES: acetyl-CoA C-acyltransferase [Ensifer]|uniref:Acetyl-CoA C-acyltransferase n=1 Tax=Ensifer canadensis TaxID=555315 RepID=A0AAW4FTV8_9HYPH|nr:MULTISPECIES: acetyl-CoA C-acyltransferase [Ensifer]KQU82179.1 acetyl-CoA acetyltransferase [Ensifer sp. Root31]KQW55493.1 acetyl-CoA acetyltransferase [Ensifer sp. Root1252]KQW73620.1 acetyl-CoA acetyltransferase [Ensifer sp. Root127]KQY69762.1 acetyl-CoA acetyltransferase [Ensifer sp. Root142]KRC71980.1 acetyl-CoA acetyltransferase [Ensifer sp. Root231]